jgi:putative addiction module killer protein
MEFDDQIRLHLHRERHVGPRRDAGRAGVEGMGILVTQDFVDFLECVSYRIQEFEVQKTDEFDSWLTALADQRAVAKIVSRVERLGLGNPREVKPVGEGISEMRLAYGPGYRIYYKQTGKTIILILCGGDKSTQDRDIERAKEIAAQL